LPTGFHQSLGRSIAGFKEWKKRFLSFSKRENILAEGLPIFEQSEYRGDHLIGSEKDQREVRGKEVLPKEVQENKESKSAVVEWVKEKQLFFEPQKQTLARKRRSFRRGGKTRRQNETFSYGRTRSRTGCKRRIARRWVDEHPGKVKHWTQ